MIHLTPALFLKDGLAVSGFEAHDGEQTRDAVFLAKDFQSRGADGLLVFDRSGSDQEHDENIGVIRKICEETALPVTAALHVKRLEDVKKFLYAGCQRVCINMCQEGWEELLKESSARFGKDKMAVLTSGIDVLKTGLAFAKEHADTAVVLDVPAAWTDAAEIADFVFTE